MERRDAVKYTALFLGSTLSAATISALLSGCSLSDGEDWQPGFLSLEESEFIDVLGEIILPRTSTPGAHDAKAVRFIDAVRPLRYTEEENLKFKADLTAFMQKAQSEIGKEFTHAPADKKETWVRNTDKEAYEQLHTRENTADENEERPFYIQLKEQIAAGYFSSEIVAKEFFAFDPNPGRFDPCIPYDEVGRAWALG